MKIKTLRTSLANAIVSGRWAIIASFIVLLVAAAAGIPKFKIAASADTLLVKDNELYIQTQMAEQTFSPDEFILLAYEPTEHDVFSEQTFNDLAMLSDKLSQIERVESTTSILSVPLIDNADALTGQTDVSDLTWLNQRYAPETMRDLVSGHPIFTDLLINRDNSATAIQIVFQSNPELVEIEQQITNIKANLLDRALTDDEQQRVAQLQSQAEPLRAELTRQRKQEIAQINAITQQVNERANTYLGGSYVVGQHLIDIIRADLVVFGLAIAVVIALLLAVLFKRIKWVVFPLLSCGLSVMLTIGALGWFDLRATVISANFVALQIILTLAVMIHMLGSYRYIVREQPELNQHERVKRMLEDKLAPCFFASLTTSVGFAALLFSGLEPVISFGIMMLIAMLISQLVSLLLFPALLALFPAGSEATDYRFITRTLAVCRSLSLNHPGMTIITALVLFAALGAGITRLNVENSFINYFAKDTRVYQELAYIDKQFGGTTALDIIIDVPQRPDDPSLMIGADSVNQLTLVQSAVTAFEATGSVTSLVNFTELAKQLNGNRPLTEYELSSIYYLLNEKVVNQLVGAYFSEEHQQLRIAVRIQDTTEGLNREQFMSQLKEDLATVGVAQDGYQLTSLFVLYQDILSRLFDSQINTLGVVYVALGLVFLLIFRSIKVALIALLPNILTTLAILGVIGWAGIPLDIMTITIAAIAMGIAVDDTLHFVHCYLASLREEGHSQSANKAQQAANSAFKHSGLAILMTTTVIAVGFSLFGFSDFLPSVYFGLLTALAMIMALVADLTVLPALLNKWVAPDYETKNETEGARAN
ncbi:efflux RND transporter permease subunit [Alteromonas gilva]|uniref:MMPL family transporter n=1 Tax=Alteromonas gilva TaxID=2987522 RepID=A0ABT5L4J5_9ALTE|nr:MMPL family transporter [Alteromonas gilva]MDC8830693.1 MMPL family transporter [Alteromonas gilva]